MPETGLRLVCQGCGRRVAPEDALAFHCPARGGQDDIDHLLGLERRGVLAPMDASAQNPFVAFRARSFSHSHWIAQGEDDQRYVELVTELDDAVARVAGCGFRFTPWANSAALGLRFKDESGNVAGSHKARHLFGIAILVEVAERTGMIEKGVLGSARRPLSIASCGNAALAAATLARAWDRSLRVFIPAWAEASVVQELRDLGADIVVCERTPSSPPGDPCLHAFRMAVAEGALPFTCQGTENGLTIDGGMTLGFELAEALCAPGAEALEHLFIQVGGGALASATAQALQLRLDATGAMPAIHAVQSVGCAPLVQAWRALTRDLKVALGASDEQFFVGDDRGLAQWLAPQATSAAALACFAQATRQRSRYMRTVDAPQPSLASGILDDETYDWFAVVRAMIESGGWPLAVDEADLLAACDAARAEACPNLSATGAAGLAGYRVALRLGQLSADDSAAVLFTGMER